MYNFVSYFFIVEILKRLDITLCNDKLCGISQSDNESFDPRYFKFYLVYL